MIQTFNGSQSAHLGPSLVAALLDHFEHPASLNSSKRVMTLFPQIPEEKRAFFLRQSVLRKDDAAQMDRVG